MKKIVLASKSPRRKALLEQIGLRFEIDVSDFDEKNAPKLPPSKLAEYLSLEKAKIIAKKHKNSIIIAADTFVVFENEILGKPKTKENAVKMLKRLSGKEHKVITGFTLIDTEGRITSKFVESKVVMRNLTNEEIKSYVETGEPLDKAGGYGIQELGSVLIEKVIGDYYNVVGLPLAPLYEELKKLGVNIF